MPTASGPLSFSTCLSLAAIRSKASSQVTGSKAPSLA
jgi:hypothetical protein